MEERVAYWLTLHGLLNLLSYTIQATCLRVALPTVSWALLHQFSIEEMLSGHAYRSIAMEVFS